MGKTSLLDAAARLARHEGMLVCRARGSELERSFPFGVARQLLEREAMRRPGQVLTGAAALAGPLFTSDLSRARTSAGTDGRFSMLHGLYWVVSNVCEQQPALFVVDDAHLADDASARFLAFLASRVTELPLAVAVATRPLDDESAAGPLAAMITRSDATRVDLLALSPTAVASLVTSTLGQATDRGFVEACVESTGGNPFYLHELLREVAAAGVAPRTENAGWVARIGPAQIVGSLLARVASMPAGALNLAAACAVLGDGARLVDCATLAQLAPEVPQPLRTRWRRRPSSPPASDSVFVIPSCGRRSSPTWVDMSWPRCTHGLRWSSTHEAPTSRRWRRTCSAANRPMTHSPSTPSGKRRAPRCAGATRARPGSCCDAPWPSPRVRHCPR